MINTLNPGHLGITGLTFSDTIELAGDIGFDAVAFSISEAHQIATDAGIDAVKSHFAEANVLPGDWGAPIDWRGEDRATELEKLRPLAHTAAELGATVTATWVLPGDNDRPREEQYEWFMERLRPFAQVLADAGIRLGLEFIGPKTLRDEFAHEFVWRMDDMLTMARDVGTGNVGLLFDTFHFYTAGHTLDELRSLSAEDIVLVHTNDAPTGLSSDEQLDGVRTLPMETGVIDAPAMLRTLHEIGYRGLVETEPFSEPVREVARRSPQDAARMAFDAQVKLLTAAGIR